MGELYAIGSAFFWAVNSLLVRSQAHRIDSISLNALQYLFAAIFFLPIPLLSGQVASLTQVAPTWLGALVATALIGMGGGDTLYVRSLGLIGVSRAFPVATSGYLLLTFVVAVALLGEAITVKALLGGAAVAGGISLVALSTPQDPSVRTSSGRRVTLGLLSAAGAALCWAIAVSILKLALAEVDVVTANAIRLPVVALSLLALSAGRRTFRPKDYGWRPTAVVGLAGVLGITIGSLFFLRAVQAVGAAKTAVLSSTSPLFAVPLSILFLGERPSLPAILGTLLCVGGVILLV